MDAKQQDALIDGVMRLDELPDSRALIELLQIG
jgi:hypothetical protein